MNGGKWCFPLLFYYYFFLLALYKPELVQLTDSIFFFLSNLVKCLCAVWAGDIRVITHTRTVNHAVMFVSLCVHPRGKRKQTNKPLLCQWRVPPSRRLMSSRFSAKVKCQDFIFLTLPPHIWKKKKTDTDIQILSFISTIKQRQFVTDFENK